MEKENSPKIRGKIIITILLTAFLTSALVVGGLLIYVAKNNPFNIQACIISSFLTPSSPNEALGTAPEDDADSMTEAGYDHPLLSHEQEDSLEKAGISVESIPTTISPELEACFVEKLGQKRVDEIINGDTPGPLDVLRGRQCL